MAMTDSKHQRQLTRTAVIFAAAGLACFSVRSDCSAAVKSWNTGNGLWSVVANWSPAGAPAAGDAALIGPHAGAENAIVTMNQSDTIASLTLNDGMTLRTSFSSLQVNGITQVSGQNIVGPSIFTSQLRIQNGVLGDDFTTDGLSLTDFGRVTLENGAAVFASDVTTIGANSSLAGAGSIVLSHTGAAALNNNGRIAADGGLLELDQGNTGLFDLDGSAGNGILSVGEDAELNFASGALTDAFDGTIELVLDSVLDMDVTGGWTAGGTSEIVVTGQPSGVALTPAIISGTPVTLAGNIDVTGENGVLRVQADATLAATLVANINAGDKLEFINDVQIVGGDYNLASNASLEFWGATTVAGGTFATSGVGAGAGRVNFYGETTWGGVVTLHGRSRQTGDATVIATTVINADQFDMDGNIAGNTEWDVNAGLIINADQIEESPTNDFDGVINIGGGIANKLTINLTDPAHEWRLDGQLNLSSSLPGVFFTRVAGSRMVVGGDVNVINADADIAADVVFENDSSVHLTNAGSDLRLSGKAMIAGETTFIGQGRILNNGERMELGNGLSLGQAGLVNNGTLHIGVDGVPAQAFVDRFASNDEARLEVAVGGSVPGTELSHLIVTGGTAQVDGILAPTLIDVGGSLFAPEADDVFTIITAPGGVVGTFDSLVQPLGLPTGLLFEVAYSANSVSLFMGSTYEADFDRDGDVDNADYSIWKSAFGDNNYGDANGDFLTDAADYTVWRNQLGSGVIVAMASAVPEPGTISLALLGVLALRGRRR
jgi:hypothetical protein